MSSITLTDAELAEVTRRGKPSAQARILTALGIPFAVHPVDGVLLVARDAARSVLSGNDAGDALPTVDIEAMRRGKHGTAAKGRR